MTTSLTSSRPSVRRWPARRWLTAIAVAGVYVLVVGIPTDLIDTPLFWREIPPTWWSWPALLVSAALAGLLTATYVATSLTPGSKDAPGRGGVFGGVLTFFAVGCPVCNKLVLLALGYSGAMTWFEPVQPMLQLLAVLLLAWALVARLRGEQACAIRPSTSPR